MADENTDGGGPSTVSEDTHQTAARIAQKLREAGLNSQILNLVPADTAVLRRDRVVIILALTLLTALAWSYLLWLSADMSMGGMDMGDFRMIPSGMGLMVPAHTPWQAMEFEFVFVMWIVMMVGMMTPSAAPMIAMYSRVGRHIPLSGSLSRCSPLWCNGDLSVLLCSIPGWQARSMSSVGSCSSWRALISGPASRTYALPNARSRLRS